MTETSANVAPGLVARDLTVRIDGVLAVERARFELPVGCFAALVGPNGGGKTSLVRAMLGLTGSTGNVQWRGQDPRANRVARSRIGYVPQRLDFDRGFPVTVEEYLALDLGWSGGWPWPTAASRARLTQALDRFDAGRLLRKPLGGLSGGELQRVLLAQVLLTPAELILLDEPSAALDAVGERRFYELLGALNREQGVTLVLISHNLEAVLEYATHVIALNRTVRYAGPISASPPTEFLREAFGLAYHTH